MRSNTSRDRPKSLKQVVTTPLLNTRQQVFKSVTGPRRWPLWTDGQLCHNWCGTVKNPHFSRPLCPKECLRYLNINVTRAIIETSNQCRNFFFQHFWRNWHTLSVMFMVNKTSKLQQYIKYYVYRWYYRWYLHFYLCWYFLPNVFIQNLSLNFMSLQCNKNSNKTKNFICRNIKIKYCRWIHIDVYDTGIWFNFFNNYMCRCAFNVLICYFIFYFMQGLCRGKLQLWMFLAAVQNLAYFTQGQMKHYTQHSRQVCIRITPWSAFIT